jgi:hypothetical protein
MSTVYQKHIERAQGEFGTEYDAFLDGEYIGTFITQRQAERRLDELAYDRASRSQPQPAAEIAGTPVAFLEEEAQRRSDVLTGESHSESQDEAAHARRRINALNKALMHALQGVPVRESLGDYLIASGTRGGVVHRVSSRYGCSCEAGQKNQPCWHSELVDLLLAWQDAQVQAA